MQSFSDIFKSSFLDSVTEITLPDIVLAMVLACVLGFFISFIYKKTFQGVMYSSGFGITLVGLTMVTTLVILAVTSNVVLSLGMVGALSIVRFRSAIKEPFEIVFLFWALAAGIVVGANMWLLSIVGSLLVGIILLVFARRRLTTHPFILVVNCSGPEAEAAVADALRKAVGKYAVKAKTVTAGNVELSVEITLKNEDTGFVTEISALPGVGSACLVTYNGQFVD